MQTFLAQGSPTSRRAAPRDMPAYHDAHSDISDIEDGSSLPPSPPESVASEQRSRGLNSADELSDLDIGRSSIDERILRLEEYTDYLRDDLADHVRMDVSSDSGSAGSRSPPPTPLHLVSRLRDLGFPDSELSDQPDYLGDETESDGELSRMNSVDEGSEFEVGYDEVPNPPQLPAVEEERLQEVWPLGDTSFNIFLCPITHDVMTDPVVCADGYTYERFAIARWFETSRQSPVTGQTLPHTDLIPNHSVRTLLKTLIDMTDKTRPDEEADKTRPDGETDVPSASMKSPTVSRPLSSEAVEETTPETWPQNLQARLEATWSGDRSGDRSDRHPRGREAAMLALLDDLRRGDAVLAVPDELRQAGGSSAASLLLELNSIGRGLPPRPAIPCPTASAGDTSNSALSGLRPLPARPASQPQPQSQSSTSSQPRPQSSTGCPQRLQLPSTPLPPLRPGQTPSISEPGVPRGMSPPLVVPPLSHRSGALPPRPSQPPPFPPPPAPGESFSSQAAASAVGGRSAEGLSPAQSPAGHMMSRSLKRSSALTPTEFM